MTTEFSQRLDFLLEKLGWTHADLAVKSGISKPTISRWLSQGKRPRSRSITKIVEATGASKAWLVSGTGQMFAGCSEEKAPLLMKLIETWDGLSDNQIRKIMITAELLPPEVEATRPSPPYRKNLCDWILLNAARYANLEEIGNAPIPPAIRDFIQSTISEGRLFWLCVSFYSEQSRQEIDSLLD